ncbi:MAG: hypothetical protein AB8B55_22350 [Mariniblastus sp.]
MAEHKDLSPWAHPKAQAWYSALLRRTSFPLALEDELRKPDDQLSLETVRMMLAFGVLLGREGIWSKEDNSVLKQIVQRARDWAKQPAKGKDGKPLSIAEHQAHGKRVEQLSHEIELVRRQLKMSNRKSKIGTPPTWDPFWD